MLDVFQNLSLKFKVTAFTLGLFLIAIGVVTYQFTTHIRDELEITFSKHQSSEVSSVAERIDDAIKLRIDALIQLAKSITPQLMANGDQLTSFLSQQNTTGKLFTLGSAVISKEGKGIADFPQVAGRANGDFTQSDYFRHVLTTEKPYISKPAIGRFSKEPVLILAVPIFDNNQHVAGVITGVIGLKDSILLSDFDKRAHPNSSSYHIVAPEDNLFVTSTDSSLIMKSLPVAGLDSLFDRYRNGFEGSGVSLGFSGIEELSSAKWIRSVGWFVEGTMPTDQAFKLIRHIRDEAIGVSGIVSVFFTLLVWFYLRHELLPLEHSVNRIQSLASKNDHETIPLEGSPEIQRLQTSFNHLQTRIANDEVLLRGNEALYRAMFENHTAVKLLIDYKNGAIVDANKAAAKFYGWSVEQLRQMNIAQLNTLPEELIRKEMELAASQYRPFCRFNHRLATGEVRNVEVNSAEVNSGGKKMRYSIVTDVTERELALWREKSRGKILGDIATGMPTAAILQNTIQMLETELPDTACAILQVSRDGKNLLLGSAPSLPVAFQNALQVIEIGANPGPISLAAANGERTVIENLQTQTHSPEFIKVALQANFASCWVEPVLSSGNTVLGVLSVYGKKTGAPNPEQLNHLEQAGKLISITLERKKDEDALRLSSSVFRTSTDAILITDEKNHIIAVNPAFTRITQYSLQEVLGKDPKILSSGDQEAGFYKTMWQTITAQGKWKGEIINRRKDGESYSEWLSISTVLDDQNQVQQRIGIFSDISDKKRTEEIIWQQANYDTLTGLPNRRLFHDRLAQEMKKTDRENIPLALLFIDLDHFKEVNDTLGHESGDMLLQQAAIRISKCVRESDTVARLGGDEFTVILPRLTDTQRLESIAHSLVASLSDPFTINQNPVYVSASIGITIYPNDADNISSLLKNADQAMYVAKNKGRNQFSYFTSSMQKSAHLRLQLSNDLRVALDEGQFEIYYQPIIELGTGQVSKAEALIRWHHPQLGLISPATFIPLAEEIGLINSIGDWVFRQSALQALNWHLNKPSDMNNIQISINKSPRQFGAALQSLEVIEWLHKLALPPSCIVIEITEGLLMDDREEVKNTLLAYRDAGIQVSLDDFGTGYSTMSYLQRFDIDYIKIDQSFVRNMVTSVGDQAIVEAIIVMAHKLGMKVIAEGVETVQQRDMLASAGCDYGQGYLFSRPIPAAEFNAYLSKSNNLI